MIMNKVIAFAAAGGPCPDHCQAVLTPQPAIRNPQCVGCSVAESVVAEVGRADGRRATQGEACGVRRGGHFLSPRCTLSGMSSPRSAGFLLSPVGADPLFTASARICWWFFV